MTIPTTVRTIFQRKIEVFLIRIKIGCIFLSEIFKIGVSFILYSAHAAVFIERSELHGVKDKTNRYLRLREHLLKNSMNSDLIVMTLPMPRINVVSGPLYMAWLESLSRGLPPVLFVRGNQSSVLTFYS